MLHAVHPLQLPQQLMNCLILPDCHDGQALRKCSDWSDDLEHGRLSPGVGPARLIAWHHRNCWQKSARGKAFADVALASFISADPITMSDALLFELTERLGRGHHDVEVPGPHAWPNLIDCA